jgi:hypothetical protein
MGAAKRAASKGESAEPAGGAGPWTRRDVAALMGWGYNTARRGLDELVRQELVSISDKGPPARYRLLDRSVLGSVETLVAPSKLRGLP